MIAAGNTKRRLRVAQAADENQPSHTSQPHERRVMSDGAD